MKTLYSILFVVLAAGFAACTNTDDLENDIEQLKTRVAALESEVSTLNQNISAIQDLAKGGKTITNIVHNESASTYTLTLNDGTVLTLMEHTSSIGQVPQIGIDADGYWQVSYDGGKTFKQVLVDNAPVKAKGEDGATPSFRVSEEGYWQVSTNGSSYENVPDVDGKPVKAIYDESQAGSDFFKSVTATDTELSIVLLDGTELTVPVVKGFFCYFDEKYTGVQQVEAGKSAVFDLHIKGAENVIATAPEGWTVTVGEPTSDVAQVTVTAPAASGAPLRSRATADNTQDVSVLAICGSYAQIAKIQVETGGTVTPDPEPEPVALISEVDASTTITDFINKDPQSTEQTSDFWFTRRATETEAPTIVDETINGEAVKAFKVVSNSNFGWYKMALGFYKKNSGCSNTKKYKVSMQIKAASGVKVQYIIRNNGGTANFVLCDNNGASQSPKVVTTYTSAADEWVEHSTVFDFSLKRAGSPANSATSDIPSTTADDVASFELRIYSNGANTTFYVANIKMEEFSKGN